MAIRTAKRLSAVFIVVAAGAVAVIVASAGRSHSTASASAVSVDRAFAVPVLKRVARADDTPPANLTRMIAARPGVDQAGIRSFSTDAGRGYVIPQADGLCIAIPDPVDGFGKACAPSASASKTGVAVLMVDPTQSDRATIALALPAGATATAIDNAGGSAVLAAEADNVVVANLSRNTAKVHIAGPSGSTDIPMPVRPPALPHAQPSA
ncbi:hypothetical protein FSW04_24610 [Baekduia soli]|uniref:Uncharacterized protein n=1 Tax=Baekduia soli TaxID=496014 RepID=A0A5B8UCQ5_9ACTN|nr:hypothetical protein [Baekduia soli]QEC50451.1 hypothetical protein FSW04_24610 [Baekduia soli]